MKNKIKLFGAFVMVVLVGFSINACASNNSFKDQMVKSVSGPITWSVVYDIAYGNGMFVAVGSGSPASKVGSYGKIAYSSDGLNWTDVPDSTFYLTPNGSSTINEKGNVITHHGLVINYIVYGNGMFVAGGSGRSRIWYSPDGINWTAHPDNTITQNVNGSEYEGIFSRFDDRYLYLYNKFGGHASYYSAVGIVYGNGRFVLMNKGGYTATSSNGKNWTIGYITGRVDINDIAYGNDRVVAVGDGATGTLDGVYRGRFFVSTDGINWDGYVSPIFASETKDKDDGGNDIYGIIFGNDRFVAWSLANKSPYRPKHGGKMACSNDGISWMPVSNTTFGMDSILDIAYGNGRFVAVGENGKIAYSNDGINWTAVLDPAFGFSKIYSITYGNGRFIATGEGDIGMAYSTDGSSWTSFVFDPLNQGEK